MLHQVTPDGGLGFCHQALPDLLPRGYHGPLVIALDSNILIDLREHDKALLDDAPPPSEVKPPYADDLEGLAALLHLWLLRDIRFIVTPRSLTDARKVTERFTRTRQPAVDAVAATLAFQFGDWNHPAPSVGEPPAPVGRESGLPSGADRDLVLEAQSVAAHAFLTRDDRVLERTCLSGPPLQVSAPHELAAALLLRGVQPFFGGTCGTHDCPYKEWDLLAPDIGKWGPFMDLFEES